MARSYAKFRLLFWKNYLLQRRNLRQTFFEILLPIVFTALLLLIRSVVEVNYVNADEIQFGAFKPDLLPNKSNKLPPKNNDSYAVICDLISDIGTSDILNSSHVSISLPPDKDFQEIPWIVLYAPQTTYLKSIMKDASADFLSCGFDSAKKMVDVLTLPSIHVMSDISIPAQLIFLAGVDFSNVVDEKLPDKIEMTLRFPGERRVLNTTDDDDAKVSNIATWVTNMLFPLYQRPGPRMIGSKGGGSPGYYEEGFLALQNAISKSLVRSLTEEEPPEITLQRFPYPSFLNDPLLNALSAIFPLIILLSYGYSASNIVRAVTTEKEKQIKETMKMMGLDNWLHWTAWFVKSILYLLISLVVITVLLCAPVVSSDKMLLRNSDWTLVFVFLLIFLISSISFAFMMSTFFDKANTAAMVSYILWFIFYLPYQLMSQNYTVTSLGSILAASILHNTAMSYGCQLLIMFEGTGNGLQWSSLFSGVSPTDHLTMAHIMAMLILDTILYALITIYVDGIAPGNYGIPLPWNFPFTKAYWFGEVIKDDRSTSSQVSSATLSNPNFEEDPEGLVPGIKILNLRKEFKRKVAVNDLNLKIYEGQITVLLGHNGAGKTTTMSMLTGMIAPTKGTAIVSNRDIRRDMSGVREELGLCPQHNILFDQLTVKEHLDFFGKLKGLKGEALERETTRFIQMLELTDKTNISSSMLSGGMQRKLCVAIALCGNSKMVLLDEPTSGMDPSARRALWELLQNEKKNRTMVLTTHFMDEADFLGDRIAIMSEGRLQCVGSPFFLKKRFGGGYTIIMVKEADCDPERVTEFLQQFMPEIQPVSNIGSELSYHLDDKYFSQFHVIFSEFEENMIQLKISSYGVSHTTMEEVFIKAGSEAETNVDEYAKEEDRNNNGNHLKLNVGTDQKKEGITRVGYQIYALVQKHVISIIRGWILYFVLIAAVLFVLIMAVLSGKVFAGSKNLPALHFSLRDYENPVVILSSPISSSSFFQNFKTLTAKDAEVRDLNGQNVSQYIFNESEKDVGTVDQSFIMGCQFLNNDAEISILFNNQPYHVLPLTLMYAYNAFLRNLNNEHSIDIINYPLPYREDTRVILQKSGANLGFAISFNLGLAFNFVMSYFIYFYVMERVSKAKLIQYVSGVNVFTFWLTSFVMNLLFSIGPIVAALITLVALQQDGFSTASQLGMIFVVLISAMVSSLPLSYVASHLFEIPATGITRLTIFHVFTGLVTMLIVFIMQTPSLNLQDTANILDWIFTIFPGYALSNSVTNLYQNYLLHETCGKLYEQCAIRPSICCRSDDIGKCGGAKCLFWPDNYFDFKPPGVGRYILACYIVSFVLFSILFLWEFRIWTWFSFKKRVAVAPDSSEEMDLDVKEEALRVANASNNSNNTNLLVRNLTKFYGNFPAVRSLNLMVNKGECFGLLGVNGAGKTTTFKMLTGDISITSGDVIIRGFSLKKNRQKVYQMIGYCPQFDAVISNLTGRETLRIFCLMRGIPKGYIDELSKKLANELIFAKHLDNQISAYSGGNKRKLSTAIAMIGDPPVLFLDEPTTGMDPVAKRHLWNVLCKLRDSGKTIILTSHSMEECEALCTRLAIMVNGEFKCLGSSQHLKSKFADCYTLTIKCSKNLRIVQEVKNFVEQQFQGAILKEEFQGMLTYNLPKSDKSWAVMFRTMESAPDELEIEDYSLGQSSLEQVFLSFTKYQKTSD